LDEGDLKGNFRLSFLQSLVFYRIFACGRAFLIFYGFFYGIRLWNNLKMSWLKSKRKWLLFVV